MIAAIRLLLLLGVVAAISVGCGGASGTPATAPTSTDTKSTSARASVATLKAAVRTAIHANVQLSSYVLWHNSLPAWATHSTRGPALKALRDAAATRRKQGIQIKNLSGGYTITSITLAPSYATATADVRSHQRVAPYKSGRQLGKAISASDHARIQLHRLANSQRFIVWHVSTLQ
jgi:hypothetical protein